MKTLETHICVSPEEFAKNPVKYVVGDIKDLEKYDPPHDKRLGQGEDSPTSTSPQGSGYT